MSDPTLHWTADERAVMAAIRETLEQEDRAMVATVTGVEGSAYRRPGAKMLVRENGDVVGHVTADCLEDQVRKLAAEVIENGSARLETFDLTGDDEVWGLGTGCNGIIDLLLEPVTSAYGPIVDTFAQGKDVAVCTVLDGSRTGAHAYATTNGTVDVLDGFPSRLADGLVGAARNAIQENRTDVVTVDETRILVDAVTTPPRLLVVGTGHDAQPLVRFADRVGYEVHVVGYRGGKVVDDRFPAAERVISTSPRSLAEAVELDEKTFAVVLTHNFIDDRLSVEALLDTPVPYIGLMGPRERFEEMQDAFGERTFSSADRDRIYTPVGLDIGGETPAEIALSIISEVQAVRHGRNPTHLSDREGPIHDRPDVIVEDP